MILSCRCPIICKECVREAEKRLSQQFLLHPEVGEGSESEEEMAEEETKKGKIQ